MSHDDSVTSVSTPPLRRDFHADVPPTFRRASQFRGYKQSKLARASSDIDIADSQRCRYNAVAVRSNLKGGHFLVADAQPHFHNRAPRPQALPAASVRMTSSVSPDSCSSSSDSSSHERILNYLSTLARLYPHSALSLPISKRIKLAQTFTLRCIDASKLSGDKLGQGGFGTVFHIRVPYDPCVLTAPALPLDLPPFSTAMKCTSIYSELLAKEIITLNKLLDTEHTVQLLECCMIGEMAYICMELLGGVTLQGILQASNTTGDPISTAVITLVARQVAKGLHEMHLRGLVHMDVKHENVGFIGAIVKVMDMGLAQQIGAQGGGCGTEGFMSPEVS